MNMALLGARVWLDGRFEKSNLFVRDGLIAEIASRAPQEGEPALDCGGCHIFPGFTDAHVHLREPGFSYKETIRSGTLAAARGGYAAVLCMPNVNPMPDSLAGLRAQTDLIAAQARVRVLPFGTITRGEKGGELADLDALAPFVAGFSDDGRGIQDEGMMREALLAARGLNKVIAAHIEDEGLAAGGLIHRGAYAAEHRLPGNPSESEWRQLERDIRLLRETGAAYHACHVSTRESVGLIRAAKAEGLDITAETAPHYLLLNDLMLQDEGRFRMNPPIRGEEDRLALLEGLKDGTIDMVATDHAPNSAQEKAGGLKNSLNGIVGLETAFPLLYHRLVKPGILPLSRLVDALHDRPNRRFGLPAGLAVGRPASLCVWDLDEVFMVDSSEFLSKGRATPFEGWQAAGRCRLTLAQGRLAYREGL